MKPITFVEPGTLAEARAALAGGSSRLIAGGSDLLGELKEGTVHYDSLISLSALPGMRGIEQREGGLHIGALATLADLEYSTELTGPYQILAEAARGVATPEIRNQGTLGGNLCQRPRCMHYRSALIDCLRKGGDTCPAVESPYQNYLSISGGNGCYAVNASDLGPPLIALGATALIEGDAGERGVPMQSFFVDHPQRETCLEHGEVLTGVVLPPLSPAWRGSYSKSRERTAGDFPIVGAALGFELVDGRMQGTRVVLGGVGLTPLRSHDAEALLNGREPSQEVAAQAADAALAVMQPLSHNAFKLDLARALILRGVVRLAGLPS